MRQRQRHIQEFAMCKTCRESRAHYKHTERGAFIVMANSAKQHSQKLRAKHRDFPGTCTLTGPMLLAMFKKQKRRCAISGLRLSHLPGDWQTSLNRIVDKRNYDRNCHITALEFNTVVNWTKEKLELLPSLRRQLTPEEIDERITWLAHKPVRKRDRAEENPEGYWLCHFLL